jgi:hypothetical protein
MESQTAGLTKSSIRRRWEGVSLSSKHRDPNILHLLQQNGYEVNEAELREILQKVRRGRWPGKAEISRMAIEMGIIMKRLNFPMEAFWEIVKGVLKKDVYG